MKKQLIEFVKDALGNKSEVDPNPNPIQGLGGSLNHMYNPGFLDSVLMPYNIKPLKKELFKLELFKNVKKINILKEPMYRASVKTGDPIKSDENYIGQETKNVHTITLNIGDDAEFNEVIDIYSISIKPSSKLFNKELVKKESSKVGVWKMPMGNGMNPREEIRIVWDVSNFQDEVALGESNKTLKERVLDLVSKALDMKESNLPFDKEIVVRCSPRSFKQDEIPKPPGVFTSES